MTNGYFLRWRTSYITHFLVLHFPRWRLSQISHPGDVQDVKFPTHVRFTGCNSRGLLPLPILRQTIDRCISTPINGLPQDGGGGGGETCLRRILTKCNVTHLQSACDICVGCWPICLICICSFSFSIIICAVHDITYFLLQACVN